MTRGIPKIGDVLITTEAPLGNVALVNTTEKFALAQRIINLSPNTGSILGAYLMNVLLSDGLQTELLSNQSGSTVYGIKASSLKTIEVPVPPLAIQERIVKKIEDEHALVESAKN